MQELEKSFSNSPHVSSPELFTKCIQSREPQGLAKSKGQDCPPLKMRELMLLQPGMGGGGWRVGGGGTRPPLPTPASSTVTWKPSPRPESLTSELD